MGVFCLWRQRSMLTALAIFNSAHTRNSLQQSYPKLCGTQVTQIHLRLQFFPFSINFFLFSFFLICYIIPIFPSLSLFHIFPSEWPISTDISVYPLPHGGGGGETEFLYIYRQYQKKNTNGWTYDEKLSQFFLNSWKFLKTDTIIDKAAKFVGKAILRTRKRNRDAHQKRTPERTTLVNGDDDEKSCGRRQPICHIWFCGWEG